MIRINYHHPGTPPATLLPRVEPASGPPGITLIQYDATTIYEGDFDSFEEMIARYDPARVNWINIDGLTDPTLLRQVGARFGIHPLALEDVLNTAQRPKVEHYPGHFFIVTEMIYAEETNSLSIEQVSMVLGDSFVITFQEEHGRDCFEAVRVRLRAGRGYARQRGPDYLAYALLDSIVDEFFPILEALGEAVEELEEALIERPSRALLRRLYEVKRLLVQLRRVAWPEREVLNALMRDETGLVTKETQIFLRDCYDHITQTIDIIESFRDLAAGLMDVYLSSLGVRTNEIMRVLTAVSTIFIPLTFIAGVYGMNFDTDSPWNMPELNWRYGYIFFWSVTLAIGIGTYAYIRRKHWL